MNINTRTNRVKLNKQEQRQLLGAGETLAHLARCLPGELGEEALEAHEALVCVIEGLKINGKDLPGQMELPLEAAT